MTNVYFDIETIGSDDPAVTAEIAAGIKPPGNYSKPETIAKWEAEEKPGLIKEAMLKTAFDGGVGRIVCIGWAVNDGTIKSACGAEPKFEADLLTSFFRDMKEAARLHYHGGDTKRPMTFIGHNITGFDLRFLWQRAVINGIKPPSCIPFNVKPWDNAIADTMLMWNPERDRRTSLDKLCKCLGIESPKGELDGSKVWEYVKAGRISEVADYCRKDVEAIRACYRRMAFLDVLELA